MKRLFAIILYLVSINVAIVADELMDSLTFYGHQVATAQQIGNQEEERDGYKNILRIYKRLANSVSKDTIYAGLATQYGTLCAQFEQYEQAIEATTEALIILQNVYGNDDIMCASVKGDIAYYYSELGNTNKAIQLASQALETVGNTLGRDNQTYFLLLKDLASYYSHNDIERSIQLNKEALDLLKASNYEIGPESANLAENLSDLYYKKGDYDNAIVFALKYLDMQKPTLDENSASYVLQLHKISACYFNLEDFMSAIEYETKVKNIVKRSAGENHPLYSISLSRLASYYNKLGNYDKAIEMGISATNSIKIVFGDNHPDYATSLNNLAQYYSNINDFDHAVEFGNKAMTIRKNVLGEKHLSYAATLDNLAYYYSSLGCPEKAVEYQLISTCIYKDVIGDNSLEYAVSLNNLALSYYKFGDFNKAVECGIEVVDLYKVIFGENNPDYATVMGNLADYYSYLGSYAKAVEYGIIATNIWKEVRGENHPDYAMSLNNLALYYYLVSDYDKAIEYGCEALHLYRDTIGVSDSGYGAALCNLSCFYNTIGDKEKAMEYGQEAAKVCKSILGNNNPDYAKTLANLANCFSNLGNYEKAIELVCICMTILGEKNPYYSTVMMNLANYYSKLGNLEKAISYGMNAIINCETYLGETHLSNADSWRDLGSYYSALKDYSKALDCIKKSTSIIKYNTLLFFEGLSSEQRATFWSSNYDIFTDRYPFCYFLSKTEDASDLYDKSALFAKGLLLTTDMEVSRLIHESGDEEALRLLESLRKNKCLLQKLYETPIVERRISTDSVAKVADSLEKMLIKRSRVYGDLSQKMRTTWQDIQKSLSDDDIAIEFLSFNVTGSDSTMIAALTLRKDDKTPSFIPLFEVKQLQGFSDTDYYICPEVANLVWGPLKEELRGIHHVYFSPSGILHIIPIEYAPGMDAYNIYRLSTTREIIELKSSLGHKKNNEISTAVLYGGVDYETMGIEENSSSKAVNPELVFNNLSKEISKELHRSFVDNVDSRGRKICYLPNSLTEVLDIQASFERTQRQVIIFTGREATESSVKYLSGHAPHSLHFSTHGFYFTWEQARKNDEQFFMINNDYRVRNIEDKALTRNGLFLAGANKVIEEGDFKFNSNDGILTAYEISQLDLRGLDLVVLSACQTGLGDVVQGEGVFGLQRGFKKAGVKSILMSLWPVNDFTTQLLMVEFYKNYLSGNSKHEALKQAQKYVKEYKDDNGEQLFESPYYWAGFIILD